MALLAGVELMGVGALVKTAAKLRALKTALREMETLRVKALDRSAAFQWPTSQDIDRYAVTLGRADRPRLIARQRDGVLKIASPYDVFTLFLRSAARRRRQLAVAELVIAVSVAEVAWSIWRQSFIGRSPSSSAV
jgi:hypothetical protein